MLKLAVAVIDAVRVSVLEEGVDGRVRLRSTQKKSNRHQGSQGEKRKTLASSKRFKKSLVVKRREKKIQRKRMDRRF